MSGRSEGLTLDAGALIAVERGSERIRGLLRLARRDGAEIHVLPEVVAQVWRGTPRQARLSVLLGSPDVDVPPYDAETARAVGRLCGATGHADVVDVHVALHARLHGHAVVTSDAADLARVDPSLILLEV